MDSVRCRTAERFPTRKQSFRFPGMSGTNTERYRTINHSNLLFEIVGGLCEQPTVTYTDRKEKSKLATRGKKEKEYPPMPANWMYKRGDVYMMDLNPYSGSEQGGIRPAIVVQNDDGNFYSNVLLVVPLTTQIKKRNMPTHFILHNRF